MSLQWTLIAGFLYIEIAVVLLLVLPIVSPRKWNAFFKSKFLQGLKQQSGIYFMILLAILVLFLLDAIREMRKYSNYGKITFRLFFKDILLKFLFQKKVNMNISIWMLKCKEI